MKRVIVWVALLAAVWGLPRLSHPAVDIGKLEPVETVLLIATDSGIAVETDSGAKGSGKTLKEAIEDMRQGAVSEVYLDTTNKLLIAGDMTPFWQEIMQYFRPSCRICRVEGLVDLKEATDYLTTHPPELTLNRLRAEESQIQTLTIKEGRRQLD